jgi:hypothetical protein
MPDLELGVIRNALFESESVLEGRKEGVSFDSAFHEGQIKI